VSSENFSWNLAPPLHGVSFDPSGDDEALVQLGTAAGDLLEADAANVTVTLSSSSPVPEPSTWAMMLVGFAGVGVFSYRRRAGRRVASNLTFSAQNSIRKRKADVGVRKGVGPVKSAPQISLPQFQRWSAPFVTTSTAALGRLRRRVPVGSRFPRQSGLSFCSRPR
jgi:PEP-CTERM motif-containing protein